MKKETKTPPSTISHSDLVTKASESVITALQQWCTYRKSTTCKSPYPGDMPHYVLSPENIFIKNLCTAAKENIVNQTILNISLQSVIKEIKKTTDSKRVDDIIKQLKNIKAIDDSIKPLFAALSTEFALLENLPPGKRNKKGISQYAGQTIREIIKIDQDSKYLKRGSHKYYISAPLQWIIIDRALKALLDGNDGYVIDITTDEYNKLKGDSLQFFKNFYKRKEIPKKLRKRNERFYPKAKLLLNKILNIPEKD